MSESKKVLSREYVKEYLLKDGKTMNYSYKVKFEGDDKTYQYSSTVKDNPPYFKIGEVAEFTVSEQKYEKDGNTTIYYKCFPVKPAFVAGGGGKGYKKTKSDFAIEFLSYSESYVKDLIINGKVPLDDWGKYTDKLMKYNVDKIDEYMKLE